MVLPGSSTEYDIRRVLMNAGWIDVGWMVEGEREGVGRKVGEGEERGGKEGGREKGSSCLRTVEQCALKAQGYSQGWKPSPAPTCVVKATTSAKSKKSDTKDDVPYR